MPNDYNIILADLQDRFGVIEDKLLICLNLVTRSLCKWFAVMTNSQ